MAERLHTGERMLRGIPVSAGVCRGKILVLDKPRHAIERREILETEIPAELGRFQQALVKTREQLQEVQRQLATIARERGVLLLSDEIYKAFHYGTTPHSPAEFDENVLVIEGFGKTYGMTGWRLGFAHGPKTIIDEMMKLQQFTFVCAPSIVQYAGLAAMDYDVTGIVEDYQRKRDLLCDGLRDRFEFLTPGGAFYLFAKTPWGTGTEFVTEAVKNSLLIIPGGVFSRRDTHFRISYAAKDETLHRGIELLNRIAKR